MRTLTLSVSLLVFVTLFIFGGCKKEPGGGKFKQVSVTLINCQANPDQVYDLHNGDKVDWQSSDSDYTISFADQSEPTPNPFPVHPGVSNPPHPINGNKGCTPEAGGHYCKYSLIGTTCKADPGLHVTP